MAWEPSEPSLDRFSDSWVCGVSSVSVVGAERAIGGPGTAKAAGAAGAAGATGATAKVLAVLGLGAGLNIGSGRLTTSFTRSVPPLLGPAGALSALGRLARLSAMGGPDVDGILMLGNYTVDISQPNALTRQYRTACRVW